MNRRARLLLGGVAAVVTFAWAYSEPNSRQQPAAQASSSDKPVRVQLRRVRLDRIYEFSSGVVIHLVAKEPAACLDGEGFGIQLVLADRYAPDLQLDQLVDVSIEIQSEVCRALRVRHAREPDAG